MTDASATIQVGERDLRRIGITATLVAGLEWYDFIIFGLATALFFPALFFPASTPPAIATLLAFSTFYTAFVARGVGSVVWGHFGDRYGRKKTLVAVVLLMGVATTLIGFLPTYAAIGIAAPIALTVLRMVQGLCVAGMWGGAVLMAMESAPANKRGFYGSLAQAGAPVGLLLGNAIFLVLTVTMASGALSAWGWRIPFLSSVVLIGLGLYIHRQLEETPAFRRLEQAQQAREDERTQELRKPRLPIVEAIRSFPKQMLLAAGTVLGAGTAFGVAITYGLSYGQQVLGMARSSLLTGVLLGAVATLLTVTVFGALSDRFGRKPVFVSGAALVALWAFPYFWLFDTGSAPLFAVGQIVLSICISMMFGPYPAWISEMFDTRVRYSGISFGFQMGSLLGVGLSPLIAASLFAAIGASWPLALYLLGANAISFACGVVAPQSRDSGLQ